MTVVAGVVVFSGGSDGGELVDTLDVFGVAGSATGVGTLRGVAGTCVSGGACTLSGAGGAWIGNG